MKKTIVNMLLAIIVVVAVSCETAEYTVSSRPARPVFVRPASPGPGYVWMDGNWIWRGGRYEYENGRWYEPRAEHWHNGHWRKVRGGWAWQPGRWR